MDAGKKRFGLWTVLADPAFRKSGCWRGVAGREAETRSRWLIRFWRSTTALGSGIGRDGRWDVPILAPRPPSWICSMLGRKCRRTRSARRLYLRTRLASRRSRLGAGASWIARAGGRDGWGRAPRAAIGPRSPSSGARSCRLRPRPNCLGGGQDQPIGRTSRPRPGSEAAAAHHRAGAGAADSRVRGTRKEICGSSSPPRPLAIRSGPGARGRDSSGRSSRPGPTRHTRPRPCSPGACSNPEWGEVARPLLEERYAASPYLAFLRGESPEGTGPWRTRSRPTSSAAAAAQRRPAPAREGASLPGRAGECSDTAAPPTQRRGLEP